MIRAGPCTAGCRASNAFNALSGPACNFFHTLEPRATLAVLPPPDGSPTCRSRREESLRALAVTCGRTMEEAERRHCSAGRILVPPGRAPDQPPEKSSPLVPASAGRQPGWGWKRACGGPSCGYGEGRGVQASPWRSRIVNARPSPCRRMPQADFSRPCPGGGKRYATACRMWTPSGETRARARFAPPNSFHLPNGTACARPSGDFTCPHIPAVCRAGALPHAPLPRNRKSETLLSCDVPALTASCSAMCSRAGPETHAPGGSDDACSRPSRKTCCHCCARVGSCIDGRRPRPGHRFDFLLRHEV